MNDTAVELVVCPECHAANPPADRRCWLCGQALGTAGAGRVAARRTAADWVLTATFAVVGIAMVLVLIGVWQEGPGLAIGLAVVAAVPLMTTAVASARGRARGQPLNAGEKIVRFMVSLSIVVGILGLLVVAAVIAFLVWCFSELSGNNFH